MTQGGPSKKGENPGRQHSSCVWIQPRRGLWGCLLKISPYILGFDLIQVGSFCRSWYPNKYFTFCFKRLMLPSILAF